MKFRRTKQDDAKSRRKRGRLLDYLLSMLFLVLVALAASFAARFAQEEVAGHARVVDGDTLAFGGDRVRLKGMDAPELQQTCLDAQRRVDCGRQARDHLALLIDGEQVNCEGWEVDRYGRLVARCRARGADLNSAMVRDGWALEFGDHRAEEDEARQARRGIWAYEFEEPRVWRMTHDRAQSPEADAGSPDLGRLIRRTLTVAANWLTSRFQ